MIKEIEKEIRELQRELGDIQKEQAALTLQPCRGDSEIRKKDDKLEDLDTRARKITRTLHDLQRKRQRLMSESVLKEASLSP